MTEKAEIWTPDVVANLNEFQNSRAGHPFTCENRGDGRHHFFNGDLGGLVATVRGWECPYCDYKQNWFHGGMADGSLVNAQNDFFASVGTDVQDQSKLKAGLIDAPRIRPMPKSAVQAFGNRVTDDSWPGDDSDGM